MYLAICYIGPKQEFAELCVADGTAPGMYLAICYIGPKQEFAELCR